MSAGQAEGGGVTATLSVLVSRCQQLVAAEESKAGVHDASSNPYVQISLPGLPKLKSRTVHRSLDPVFDEQFDIDVSTLSEQELKQMKLKIVVRHQADLTQERTASDAYLGRADIAVAELLARRDEEAAAAGDQVSAAEDTWGLSDPAFKVKAKHLRMRMARMASQEAGSPRHPMRHRHPYGTVQLWAEYLNTARGGAVAQEKPDFRRQLAEKSPATATPSEQMSAPQSHRIEQAHSDVFDYLAAGMLRELDDSAAARELDESGEWSGKAMLDAILAGVHKTPSEASTSPPAQAYAPPATPLGADRTPDSNTIYTPIARPQYSPQLLSTITPIASPTASTVLSPTTALTPAAKEAKQLAHEIMGDLETSEMSTVARSARTLAAEILTERGAELENSYVENQAIRTHAMAAVELERSARQQAEMLVRQSMESTERAEVHIEAMEKEANERIRKHQEHASALEQHYQRRLEDHRHQNELHVESLEARFKEETAAAKDEAAKYYREMMEREKEHEDEMALQKAAHEKLVHTEHVHRRWASVVYKLSTSSLAMSVKIAEQRHRDTEEETARQQLSYKNQIKVLTEETNLLDQRHREAAEQQRQQHEEVQHQVAEERREQAERLATASKVAVSEAEERCAALERAHMERVAAHEERFAQLKLEQVERETEYTLSHEKIRSELLDAQKQERARTLEVETYRTELSTAVAEHATTLAQHQQVQEATEKELRHKSADLRKQLELAEAALVELRAEQQQAEEAASLERQETASQAAAELLAQAAVAEAKADEKADKEQRQRNSELETVRAQLQVMQTEKEELESEIDSMSHLKSVEAELDTVKAELEALRATQAAPVSGPLDLRTALPPSHQAMLPPQNFSSIDSLVQPDETDMAQSPGQTNVLRKQLELAEAALVELRAEQQQAEEAASLERQETASQAAAELLAQAAVAEAKADEKADKEQRQRNSELETVRAQLQVMQTEKEELESEIDSMSHLKSVEAELDTVKAELEALRATTPGPLEAVTVGQDAGAIGAPQDRLRWGLCTSANLSSEQQQSNDASDAALVSGPLDLRTALPPSQEAVLPPQYFSSIDSLAQPVETDMAQLSVQVKDELAKLQQEIADTQRAMEDQLKNVQALAQAEEQHREEVSNQQISGVKKGARLAIEHTTDMLLAQLEQAEKDWMRSNQAELLTFTETGDLGLRWIKSSDNRVLLRNILPDSQASSYEERLTKLREATGSSTLVVASVGTTDIAELPIAELPFAQAILQLATETRPLQIRVIPSVVQPASESLRTDDANIAVSLPEEGTLGVTFKYDQASSRTFVYALQPGSQAFRAPELRPGLELVEIEAASVVGLPFNETLQIIKESKARPLHLRFSDSWIGHTPGDISGIWQATSSVAGENIPQQTADLLSGVEECFELRQFDTMVYGRSLGTGAGGDNIPSICGHFTLAGTVIDQTLSMTQSYCDGRETVWTARVGQMGQEVLMTKGEWSGDFQGGFVAKRTSNAVEPIDASVNSLQPYPGLRVSILCGRDTQQASVTDWSSICLSLKLTAREPTQPPMQRTLDKLGSNSTALPVVSEQFHKQRHGTFTPHTLKVLLAPVDEQQSTSIAGSCMLSLAFLQNLNSSSCDFTGWLPLAKADGSAAGTVLAQLSWHEKESVSQSVPTALQKAIGETDCEVMELKECVIPTDINDFELDARTIRSFHVRRGQRVDWRVRVLPEAQKRSPRGFQCFATPRQADDVPSDVSETVVTASADLMLWFCPEGAATGTTIALDGEDLSAGVRRVCTHSGVFKAPEDGQLAFIVDDSLKIDQSELTPTPSAEEGVPPTPLELEPQPMPEPEPEPELTSEPEPIEEPQPTPEPEPEPEPASAAGMWISHGAHQAGAVHECFVLRKIGRDADGGVLYEGGSVDGITVPGIEALNDDGCFSLMDCAIVDGELTFRQQFHDGPQATMWRARLSPDGSELKDGQWTDARASECVGRFEAKRVRSAPVGKVEIVVSLKEPGVEEGADQPAPQASDTDESFRAPEQLDDAEPEGAGAGGASQRPRWGLCTVARA